MDKFGVVNVFILALMMYGVRYVDNTSLNVYSDDSFLPLRYVGYSFITCAWYAFPFEALEVFTFFSLQVIMPFM